MDEKDFHINLKHVFVLALVPLQLFILTPIAVYLGNHAELDVGLTQLLRASVIPGLLCFLVFLVIYKLCAAQPRKYWLILLCCLALLFWLQSNIILWDYGVLDGRNIDWPLYSVRGWIDLGLWAAVLVLGFAVGRSHLDKLIVAGITVVCIQGVYTLTQFMGQYDELKNSKPAKQLSLQDEIFQFHPTSNVIHIVVDGFQADVFGSLVSEALDLHQYREAFSGFTFYEETLGVFPYTHFSVPAFLSGRIFQNKQKISDFIADTLSGETILSLAREQSFELDIASAAGYPASAYSHINADNFYNLDKQSLENPVYYQTAQLLDISLFRSSPHFLKAKIYRQQQWLLSSLFAWESLLKHAYFRHSLFLNNLAALINTNRSVPVYKFIHVMNTHDPMVVDADCKYLGRTEVSERRNLEHQSKCTLDTLATLLANLKNAGVYDSSMIVIHGDHGGWVGNLREGPKIITPSGGTLADSVKSLASPLLAIKLPGAKGSLKTSSQLTSLLQIPTTIASTMGWPMKSGYLPIADGQDMNPRPFYYYKWGKDAWSSEHTGNILELVVMGSHYETRWMPNRVFAPGSTD